MDFIDKTLIKLAAPATRAGLFDDTALAQLLEATYDLEATPVEGPFQPVFEEVRLGMALSSVGEIEGNWNVMGSNERTEARFYLSGVKDLLPMRVDGYWRGSIQGRTAAATAHVTEARIAGLELASIDAEIASDLGGLPADPAVLENERSKRLLQRIRAHLDQPAAFTDEMFHAWITDQRVNTAGELLARSQAGLRAATMQVVFSPAVLEEPSSKSLPLAGIFLIRDVGFSVAQLLMESRLARVGLKPIGLERSPRSPLKSRESLIVIWVVPETVFDNPDWPGGDVGMTEQALRAARRKEAGQWLAREGIGLVATAP